MAARQSPTVRRRRLAATLQRLRKEAGKNRDEVAAYVGCAPATISRVESAQSGARVAEVALMLEFYGVPEEERDVLLEVARHARQRGWWHRHSGAMPDWFQVYVGLEAGASTIKAYDVDVIPGLFQTEAYMRALAAAYPAEIETEDVERRVEVRQRRQQDVLNADEPPQVWQIINEAALRREVGDGAVHREQLERLQEIARLPHVTIQVLTFDAGAHASPLSAYKILSFADPDDTDVVYIELHTSALYLEEVEEITTYTLTFDHLRAAALSPKQSSALLSRLIEPGS